MSRKATPALRQIAFILAAWLFFAIVPALAQQTIPADDKLLTALRQELDRSQQRLQLPGQKKPYFIQYIVNDSDAYSYESSFGAPITRSRTHMRQAAVFVRIGDYAQDNDVGFGLGQADILPSDDDVLAIRRALWLATDRAYKIALQMVTAKQSMMKQFESAAAVPSFAKEPPVQYFEPRGALPADTTAFEHALDGATALYRGDPLIQSLAGRLQLSVNNYYLVNTEGSALRMNQGNHALLLQGETQAPDGMRLARGYGREARTPETLPSPAAVKTNAAELVSTLKALRAAPAVAAEYRGPVLFSNDAAGVLIGKVLAPNLLAHRPPPGKSGRVLGAYGESWHSRILPESVTIVDDPTVNTFAGQSLVGSYPYDDEGVKARAVTVVDKGVLQDYLSSREPVRDLIRSNGHGRNLGASMDPSPTNFILTSSKAEPAAGLKQKLLAACKDRALEYCYFVKAMAAAEAPRLVYRVYANDGHEELVRGAVLDELDTRALRNDLVAVGDDPFVTSDPANLPVSYVSPSLLFGEVVVRPTPEEKEKLPQYAPPSL